MKTNKSNKSFKIDHPSGRVFLNTLVLRKNRRKMGLSQMGFADYSSSIREPISVASIKRAELGHPVIYRTALKLSKLFNIPVEELISDFESNTEDQYKADIKQATLSLDMVGRQGEFQYVNYLIDEMKKNGNGKTIWIRGEAGIGKTKLMDVIKKSLQFQNIKTHTAKFEVGVTCDENYALKSIVMSSIEVEETKWVELSTVSIKYKLAQLNCQKDSYLYVSQFMGLELMPKDDHFFKYQSYDTKKINLQNALLDVIKATHKTEPIVWLIEDTHFSKEPVLDILLDLVNGSHHLPIVWIMTTRSESDYLEKKINSFRSGTRPHIIEIIPLSREESFAMVQQIRPDYSDMDGTRLLRAHGNPLLLTLSVSDELSPLIFESLTETINFKLKQLEKNDLLAVRTLAAHGCGLTLNSLRQINKNPNYDPFNITHLKLISVSDGKLYFNHDIVKEEIEKEISLGVLKDIHFDIANYYEDQDNFLRAVHLYKAKSTQAPAVLLDAVRKELLKQNFENAVKLIDFYKNIDFTASNKSECMYLEGALYSGLGEFQRAKKSLELALDAEMDEEKKVQAAMELANVLYFLNEMDAAAEILDTYIGQARNLKQDQWVSKISILQGHLLVAKNDTASGRKLYFLARESAHRAKDYQTESMALSGLASVDYQEGRMHSSHQVFKDCLEICDQFGLHHIESANRYKFASTHYYLNNSHAALTEALSSIKLAEQMGYCRDELAARLTAGWVYTSLVQVSDALTQYDKASKLLQKIGASQFEPFILEGVARCHLINGQPEKAIREVSRAWHLVATYDLFNTMGARILGLQALLEKDLNLRQQFISRGLELSKSKGHAHSHYSFYVSAAEASILARNASQASHLADQFEIFAAEEPCAWSGHHIDLIRSHVRDLLNPFSGRSTQTNSRIQYGRMAGLVGASPVLHGVYSAH